MRGMVPIDPQTVVSQEHFAVVYVPKRSLNNKNASKNKRVSKRSNKRFPASCVEIMQNEEDAIEIALVNDKKFAAIVVGPSKSSEGQFIYYLREWLA